MTPAPVPAILRADCDEKHARLRQAFGEAGLELPAGGDFEEQLRLVLAFSDFAAESLVRDPALLAGLQAAGLLDRPAGPGELAARLDVFLQETPDAENLALRLRRFRRREMVRIAWRDLAGLAELAETTGDLSDLAEACLDQSLAFLHRRQCADFGTPLHADGTPMGLVVLALGKLGARELNFSSDIDLIFAYPAAGETASPPVSRIHLSSSATSATPRPMRRLTE